MGSAPKPQDPEAARKDGERLGRSIGKQAASEMLQHGLTEEQITATGAEAVATIMERAGALADAGLDRTLVAAWTEGAAEGFHSELELAASLLYAPEASARQH